MDHKTEVDYRIGPGVPLGHTHKGKQEGHKPVRCETESQAKAMRYTERAKEGGKADPSAVTGVEK